MTLAAILSRRDTRSALRRNEFRSACSRASGHHCKSSSVSTGGEAFVACRQKQSWFRFIDWRPFGFTIQDVSTRSSNMLQFDPGDRCRGCCRSSEHVAAD